MLYSSTAIQVAFCFSTMNTTNIYCLFYFILCTDPGFQVMGGALKKIAQSGGRRENIWGISCEKSRFYAKKIMFSNFREGAPPPPPPGSAPEIYLSLFVNQ